jgi:hypothetical protein
MTATSTPQHRSSSRSSGRLRRAVARSAVAAAVSATLTLAALPADAVVVDPAGDQFQVNTVGWADQIKPAVAADAAGNAVIVWQTDFGTGNDTDSTSIAAQRYSPSGAPVGTEFQVNSSTTAGQTEPAVAMTADGAFVVAWASDPSSGLDYSIRARRYSSAGAPLGDEFRVSQTATFVEAPAVAISDAGEFVITWRSGGNPSTILARRYTAAGLALGDEFKVNTTQAPHQRQPRVAVDAEGNFVVVWHSYVSGASTEGHVILAQRFSSDGALQGAELEVGPTTSASHDPDVAMHDDGDFVVVWSEGAGSSGLEIQAQRYSADGIPDGSTFAVSTADTAEGEVPKVAMGVDGDFIVTWQSAVDLSVWSVQARGFSAAGTPEGAAFRVDTFGTSHPNLPAVAVDHSGNAIVTWGSFGSPGDDNGTESVQGRRFTARPAYTFSGFAQPIDAGIVNNAKAGQTIPVRWHLESADGTPVSDPASFVSLTSNPGTGVCTGLPTDAVETYTNSSGLQYLGDGNWQYNWKTPRSYAGQCRTMTVTLGDGAHVVTFQFK